MSLTLIRIGVIVGVVVDGWGGRGIVGIHLLHNGRIDDVIVLVGGGGEAEVSHDGALLVE